MGRLGLILGQILVISPARVSTVFGSVCLILGGLGLILGGLGLILGGLGLILGGLGLILGQGLGPPGPPYRLCVSVGGSAR